MKKINRKRLNNKGFTLIELLAVVILLALVVGFVIPNVFDMVDSAKLKAIYNDSRSVADSIDKMYAGDMLVTDSTKMKLGTTFTNTANDGEWHCLGGLPNVNNANNSTTLINVLGITGSDLVLTGNTPTKNTSGNYEITTATCSALRYNETVGAYELLFVSAEGGKYDLSTLNYAFSRAGAARTLITD